MSQPRFPADHDLNENILGGMFRREPAAEFVRVRDFGLSESPDSEVLEFAAQNELLVVSHDVNTMTAAAYERMADSKTMCGLFIVQQSQPIGPVIDSLVLIWSASEAEEWQFQVVFLPID